MKIDQSFVARLEDNDDSPIVDTVLSIAKAMGADAVAEGIEVPDQHTRLLMMGCSLGQGYYFTRPAPPTSSAKRCCANSTARHSSATATKASLVGSTSRSCKTAAVPSVATTITPVLIEDVRTGCIATITIDNPTRRNAMNAEMYQAVPAACAAATAEPDLRAVIIRGAGEQAFCAGSDITEFRERRMGTQSQGYDRDEHAAWSAIESLPVPVVAAIRGSCRGGGVALALHADVRIAGDDASFSVPPANSVWPIHQKPLADSSLRSAHRRPSGSCSPPRYSTPHRPP